MSEVESDRQRIRTVFLHSVYLQKLVKITKSMSVIGMEAWNVVPDVYFIKKKNFK